MSLFRSKGTKSSSKWAPKPRSLRLESLESRELLSVNSLLPDAFASESSPIVQMAATAETPSTVVTTELDVVNAYDGVISLREAVNHAGTGSLGSTITFASALQAKTIQLNGTEIVIDKSLSIIGTGRSIAISGEGRSRIFAINASEGNINIEIGDLGFMNGRADLGGAIFAGSHVNLSIWDCDFYSNSCDFLGGAIYSGASSLYVSNSNFGYNTASDGSGGGIFAEAYVSIHHSSFIENKAKYNGGGLFLSGGQSKHISNVLIAGNEAGGGGGVYYNCQGEDNGIVFYTNSIIVGNKAGYGGGIYDLHGAVLTNTTVAGNFAVYQGGGIYNGSDGGYGTELRNSIVAKNISPDAPDVWSIANPPTTWHGTLYRQETSANYSLIGSTAHSTGNGIRNIDGSIFNVDPRFVNFTTYTAWNSSLWRSWDLHLQADSPAINTGNNSMIPGGTIIDYCGVDRIVYGTVDMGAYEYFVLTPPVVTATGIIAGVTLTWNTVFGAEQYSIWRLDADKTTWSYLGEVTGTTYTDLRARIGIEEAYLVTARHGNHSYTSQIAKATAMSLAAPVLTTTDQVGGVKLTWNVISGADKYGVWRLNADGKTWTELAFVTGTTFTDTTGRVGVAETYAVRAFRGTEKSSYLTVKGTALPATLAVPQVTATGVAGGVKLTWAAIAGADRYGVWRLAADGKGWVEFGDVTGTTFTDTTGRVGVAETYAVRAFRGTEKSSYLTVKGTALPVVLGVPQVTATGVAGGVKLTWNAVAGADRYFAWRRNATNTAWVELGSFTETTFTDTAARIGVAETYAVRAFRGTEKSSYLTVKGTALPVVLGVPQVTATGVAGGVKLTWTAIAGADRYGVWRQAADGKGWVEFGDVTGTTFTDTTGRVGVAETYAVRAFRGTEKSSYLTVKGTALPATLGVPQVTATGVAGGVKLTWTAIAGADRYFAWRRNATNTAWVELGSFTGTTFTDTAARVGVAETYAVRAYQGTKESSYITVKGTALPVTLGVPQVTATGVAGGVKLTWTAIAGADRYVAWRRNATNTAWIELGTFTGTTFTDTAARVGVAETYAVRAYQGTKESSYITVKGTRPAIANAFFDLADAEIDALFLQPSV